VFEWPIRRSLSALRPPRFDFRFLYQIASLPVNTHICRRGCSPVSCLSCGVEGLDLIENLGFRFLGCAPCGVVIESCCISMFWKPGSYVAMLDHCHLTVVSPLASCGRAHLAWGYTRACPRDGHLMDTQYRKGQAALSITASSGRNCVDKQALCLVASSLSTSHASSSFFLASEAAFSRAPKRPLAIVLVTSPNLYSLLPVASRTAPSKPLMAPRVKSPNS